MEGKTNSSKTFIILGGLFLKTKKIDVDDGTISMEFGDITVKFNIFYAKKHPMEEHFVFQIELLYELVDETYSKLFSTDFPSLVFDDTY